MVQAFAPDLGSFIGGRSINGVALGLANATYPLYISEVNLNPGLDCFYNEER